MTTEQKVAHRATDQVRVVAGFIEPVQDAQCGLADVLAGDGVLFSRDDTRYRRNVAPGYGIQAVVVLAVA
ncbi:hypothetical protein GCM10009552_43610 [Rothia nasimurium]